MSFEYPFIGGDGDLSRTEHEDVGRIGRVSVQDSKRGETIKDEEICALANELSSLLRRLSMQYLIEDERGTILGNP